MSIQFGANDDGDEIFLFAKTNVFVEKGRNMCVQFIFVCPLAIGHVDLYANLMQIHA
jgi:hypothetical protein